MVDEIKIKNIMAMLYASKDSYYYNLSDELFSKEIQIIEDETFIRHCTLKKSIGADRFSWEFEKELDKLNYIELHTLIKSYDFSESNLELHLILSKKLDRKTLKLIYEGLNGDAIYEEYSSIDEALKDEEVFETATLLKRLEKIIESEDYLTLL